jgi:hypothetical protein
MAVKSLGKVVVASAGTPVRATKNEGDPAARFSVQSISVQALVGNSGTNIYVGSASLNKSTLAGCYIVIPKGSQAAISIDLAPEGLLANEIYIDADTTNDAALISVTEQ